MYIKDVLVQQFTENSNAPLDFLIKNSYYLSVGIQFSIPPVCSPAGKVLVTESKYIYRYEGGIQSERQKSQEVLPTRF